jgi:hypothetical protein
MRYIVSILLFLVSMSIFASEPIQLKAWRKNNDSEIHVYIPSKYTDKVLAFVEKDKIWLKRGCDVEVKDDGSYFFFDSKEYQPPYRVFIFKADKNVKDANVDNGYGIIQKVEIIQ